MGGSLIPRGRGVRVELGSGVKADPEAFPDGSRGLRAVTDGGEKLGDHYTIFLFVRSR